MSGMKATRKTIGEVEMLTGIPKWELKYYIEQKLMRPSQRTEVGYWLYSDEDIQRVRLTSLCRELDFPARSIRAILADPSRRWPEALERQVLRLADKKRRTEASGGSGVVDVALDGSSLEKNGIAEPEDITEAELTVEVRNSDYKTVAKPVVAVTVK